MEISRIRLPRVPNEGGDVIIVTNLVWNLSVVIGVLVSV